MAGVAYPSNYQNKITLPLDGQFLMPIFKGQERIPTENFRMYRSGDWKIVRENGADWELYNLKNDKTELHNLATSNSAKLAKLVSHYKLFKEQKTK